MSSMSKPKDEPTRTGLLAELFQFSLYKPNQGRIVRQLSFAGFSGLGALSAWELYRSGAMSGLGGASHLVLLVLVLLAGWLAFRVVNYSNFADFLIAVEAEMNKVSWPSKTEVWNASLVVMFVIFAMSAFLFMFDIIWTWFFELIGIRYSEQESYLIRFFRWLLGG